MKLSVKAFAITCGLVWSGALLLVGLLNLASADYGSAFLEMVASIYYGYHASGSFGDLIVGVLYALVDGAISGLFFAWLYNVVARKVSSV
ncbi:MAG: hypothetical protein GY953_13505 [bacterium]|nr:hypothetical protein [bacterium]